MLPAPVRQSPVLNAHELSESVDVLAVLELRISLETEAAGLAAQRRQTAHLQAMREALQGLQPGFALGNETVSRLALSSVHCAGHGQPLLQEILQHFGVAVAPTASPPSRPAGHRTAVANLVAVWKDVPHRQVGTRFLRIAHMRAVHRTPIKPALLANVTNQQPNWAPQAATT